jgi:hypothetical protein
MDAVKEFEVTWRRNFLDAMKPKFMPEGWDIYHNHERIDEKLRRENDSITPPGAEKELIGDGVKGRFLSKEAEAQNFWPEK